VVTHVTPDQHLDQEGPVPDQTDTGAQPPPPRGPHTHAELNDARYAELAKSDDFVELRRRYRAFVFPWTIAFLVWYLLYVALSNWAPDFMGTTVVGNINVGLVMGLLQFVTTFGIAYLYAKHAAKNFDPLADKILARYQEGER
jgi:uncharacterized membrane protein (DUF485 family)